MESQVSLYKWLDNGEILRELRHLTITGRSGRQFYQQAGQYRRLTATEEEILNAAEYQWGTLTLSCRTG